MEMLPSEEVPVVKPGKLVFLLAYLTVIPCFLLVVILFALSVRHEDAGYITRQEHKPQFQALPNDNTVSLIDVESKDGRVEALEEFLKSYDSPLEDYASVIVEEADSHNIDYRLLPAIAMQESTLCKKEIAGSHNCWGFGIYGGKVTRFDSYDEAIKTVTKTLSEKYIQKGYVSPEEIVQKYTPSDTGKWPAVVNSMMSQIKSVL